MMMMMMGMVVLVLVAVVLEVVMVIAVVIVVTRTIITSVFLSHPSTKISTSVRCMVARITETAQIHWVDLIAHAPENGTVLRVRMVRKYRIHCIC